MDISLFDAIGLLGALLILLAFALLQLERLDPRRPLYSLLNAAGAAAILVSLVFAFNLAAAFIETAWLAISLYGIWRAMSRRADL